MSYDYSTYDLLYETKIQIRDNICIKNPTLEEVIKNKKHHLATTVFTVSTRELFSQFPEVDQLEARYPTIRHLIKDNKNHGNQLLGEILSDEGKTGLDIVLESLQYWTDIPKENFQVLLNGNIICQDPEWIIDKEEFEDLTEIIKRITHHQDNSDYIAPPNMTPTRHKVWLNLFKNRMKKNGRKQSDISDKILILSIQNGAYIPIDEIRKMTYYHFVKLSLFASNQEAYKLRWMLNASEKFETEKDMKHWGDM